jgi:hypothetical protein
MTKRARHPKPSAADRIAAEREARHAAMLRRGELRHDVLVRSRGRCENPGCPGDAAVWDHWLGGSGRRQQEESVETTWALCVGCNLRRTLNVPSAGHWNERFRLHCERHRYPYTPHRTKYELAFGPKGER